MAYFLTGAQGVKSTSLASPNGRRQHGLHNVLDSVQQKTGAENGGGSNNNPQ
jgi:hypothetical protein